MQIGLVGLGVMGRNLALNFRDRGIEPVVWDPWAEARASAAGALRVVETPAELAGALQGPRVLLMLVKAGAPVDDAIAVLQPVLSAGEILIDAGNSRYQDTERRASALAEAGLHHVGLGVSGGAEGARHGPAMMAGCEAGIWPAVEPLLSAVAARAGDRPCLERFGTGGAGHFVKMVHNGIEYAAMQALAEICHALQVGANMPVSRIAEQLGEARPGYLVGITREILTTRDPLGDGPLLDVIDDRAGQKGTGAWCVEASLDLGVAIPSISEAVAQRQLSSGPGARTAAPKRGGLDPAALALASGAADATAAIAVAQGLELAKAAAAVHGWAITPDGLARAWQAGSILRMPLLDELAGGDGEAVDRAIQRNLGSLRSFTAASMLAAQPVAVLASSVTWVDTRRLSPLPTRMVQAQRDRFGDHGFGRTDRDGVHHGPWRLDGA
ncbi:MAG: NAD(P)-binding domain-containing protein [Minwuia sp.]|uniref:NAD(P)-binding domain-containing protein n=1 Tax=Minwuia sp. TaxID=2493630 RepID=UPI003A84E1A4